jgi:hypothetical protein
MIQCMKNKSLYNHYCIHFHSPNNYSPPSTSTPSPSKRYCCLVMLSTEPNISPNGMLPCIVMEDGNVWTALEIPKLCGHLESLLEVHESCQMEALIATVETKLRFTLDYELWYQSSGFYSITVPQQSPFYPWPVQYFSLHHQRSLKKSHMVARMPVIQPHIVSSHNIVISRRPHSPPNSVTTIGIEIGRGIGR